MALPPGCNKRLLLLVPLKETYDFLNEVNTALSCELTIWNPQDEGFILQFDEPDGPRPELLGVSTSPETKQKLVTDKSLSLTGSWGDWSRSYEPTVLEVLERKIGAGLNAERLLRSKGKKSKKVLNPLERARAWAERLNRVQKYFGLRPGDADIATSISPVNVDSPAPWPDSDSPILFSADIEWKEQNAAHVTEIGISILDTQDLVDPPGLHGANWMKKIRSHHLRVSEYRLFVNSKYCKGCPSSFNFGTSEFIDSAESGKRVDQFFSPPYNGSPNTSLLEPEKRKLIYVGHDTSGDISQLVRTESRIFRHILFNGPEVIFQEVIDTSPLYQGLRNNANPTSLASMMSGLNVWTRDLHNAGNDARYTMDALVRMALEAAGEHEAAVPEEVLTSNLCIMDGDSAV